MFSGKRSVPQELLKNGALSAPPMNPIAPRRRSVVGRPWSVVRRQSSAPPAPLWRRISWRSLQAGWMPGQLLGSRYQITGPVGVDGTPQARALIGPGSSPLRATVIQNSYKVAETGVDLLDRMARNEPVPVRTYLASKVLARD